MPSKLDTPKERERFKNCKRVALTLSNLNIFMYGHQMDMIMDEVPVSEVTMLNPDCEILEPRYMTSVYRISFRIVPDDHARVSFNDGHTQSRNVE